MKPWVAIFILALFTFSFAYSLQDCKSLESEIRNIEGSKQNYTHLTTYSYYARLGDKYHQLGECYQDLGMPSAPYFTLAGRNYEKAGDSYYAEASKRYSYYVSAGDSYALANELDDALRVYKKAKAILESNPDININPAYVSQRIYALQNPIGIKNGENQKQTTIIPLIAGILIVFGVFLGIYYLARRY